MSNDHWAQNWPQQATTPAPEGPAPLNRPFFKKKRVLVPAGLLTLFVAIGVANPTPDTEIVAKSGSTSTVSSSPTPKTPAELAAEAKAAEVQAAADKAAAEKAAAEKAAADKAAAAKAAADKAAAQKAAAAKAAADKAAAAKAAAERAARERPVALSGREFAKLMKDPEAYEGRHFVIFGEVSQFDAATGDERFLADSGATRDPIEYGFTGYSDNTLYEGDAAMLSDVVEGDVFRATVKVLGSESYDTQIGGNTTVPKFELKTIVVYGSTK